MQRQELDQEMIYAKYYLQLKNQLYGQLYEEIPQIPQIDEKEDESGKRSNTCIVSWLLNALRSRVGSKKKFG